MTTLTPEEKEEILYILKLFSTERSKARVISITEEKDAKEKTKIC